MTIFTLYKLFQSFCRSFNAFNKPKTLQLFYLNKILDIQRRERVLFYFSDEGIRMLQNGGRQCGKVERIVASQVEICAILKWFMRKLEIFGSFKFACAILKLCIAF